MKLLDLRKSNVEKRNTKEIEGTEFIKGMIIFNKRIGIIGKAMSGIRKTDSRTKSYKDTYICIEKLWQKNENKRSNWWFNTGIDGNNIFDTTNLFVLKFDESKLNSLPTREEIDNLEIDEDATIRLNQAYLAYINKTNNNQ